MYSSLSHLDCPRCGERQDATVRHGLCPSCGSPLLARYDLEAVTLTPVKVGERRPDLWRYHELLPVSAPEHVVTLGEGMTPLLDAPRLAESLGLERVWVKDEGLLPTGTFKARGAAVGVSRAKELGATRMVMPTNGNAGAAWAAYAARAGLAMTVTMPVEAPSITRVETVVAGGDLRLIDGLISDAGRLTAAAVAASDDDWFDVATLKEPYRIEGKKTMGYEIAEQLGWQVPDVILYPAGGGVGLIGIHKAMKEMRELGWIGDKLPRLVAVQAVGCRPIVDAFEAGHDESRLMEGTHTLAFGINVPKALGDFLVLQGVRESEGTAIAVSDDAILDEVRNLAAVEGAWICPEGAACLAAARELREGGWIGAHEQVVVLNTGTGLKYPETVSVDVPVLPRDGKVPAPA